MLARRTLSLTAAESDTLAEARDHHPKPDVRARAAALLKIAAGQSPHTVAQHGLLKPRVPDSVYGWLSRFESHGLVGIRGFRHGGVELPRLGGFPLVW